MVQLDELVVRNWPDLKEVMDNIDFYTNLARHKGLHIVVKIYGDPKIVGRNDEQTGDAKKAGEETKPSLLLQPGDTGTPNV